MSAPSRTDVSRVNHPTNRAEPWMFVCHCEGVIWCSMLSTKSDLVMAVPDVGVRVRVIFDRSSRPKSVAQFAELVVLDTSRAEKTGTVVAPVPACASARVCASAVVER